jgi:hypothetical protein
MEHLIILGRFNCVRPAARGGIIARLLGVPELGDVFLPVQLDGEISDPDDVIDVRDGDPHYRGSQYLTVQISWEGIEVRPDRLAVAEVRSEAEGEAEQVRNDLLRLNSTEILDGLGLDHLAELARAKEKAERRASLARLAAEAAWRRSTGN